MGFVYTHREPGSFMVVRKILAGDHITVVLRDSTMEELGTVEKVFTSCASTMEYNARHT